MENLELIREFISKQGLKFLLVNSTNEFLVEYNTLEENSRYKITKFSGSTGEAIVTPDKVFLFVDGRYHIQADLEVDHDIVTVVKLQAGDNPIDKIIEKIPEDETLGIFSKKNSQKKYEKLASKRNIKLLDFDPLDTNINRTLTENVKLSETLTGVSTNEKIFQITKNLSDNEIIYITDLEEVSYIYNMRNFSQDFSAKIKAKALISKTNNKLFTEDKLKELENILENLEQNVFVDKSSITAFDYKLIKNSKELTINPTKIMKAQKTSAEIEHLKEAFAKTDKAVFAIREFIENNNNISEYDICQQLENEFKKQGAINLSFKPIVAKDKNSALAHYSKSSKEEKITDGSLVLIDCGAYFDGGLATDITRVFVKGKPSELHKKIYTTVLKAFLNGYNYPKTCKNKNITGFEIDNSVREFFEQQDIEGFVFNHGLGHGIGINVHEAPPNLSKSEIAKTELKNGMCFSIEPGLYKEGFFGIRLENSCYFMNEQIFSFVKMNFEKKLIDFNMLTEQEKLWLAEFEVM